LVSNPLRPTGDIELGKVKHVRSMALNEDAMNADIKDLYHERREEFVTIRCICEVFDLLDMVVTVCVLVWSMPGDNFSCISRMQWTPRLKILPL
jgi:hypothetical protein